MFDCFWGEMHLTLWYFYLFLDNFKTAFSVNDDNANYKQCNSTATKSNKSNGLMHATIGLAIVAILIIFIYIYTHLLKDIKYAVLRFSFYYALLKWVSVHVHIFVGKWIVYLCMLPLKGYFVFVSNLITFYLCKGYSQQESLTLCLTQKHTLVNWRGLLFIDVEYIILTNRSGSGNVFNYYRQEWHHWQ